jgi:hypothetical protein
VVKEKEWQAQVVSLARRLGWMTYHTYDSRRSEPGWPDLVLVRERMVIAELKTQTGRVSEAQRKWLNALQQAGVETYLWRPSDMGQVAATLMKRGRNDE